MFSDKLEAQLRSDKLKTIGDLESVFGEKSFAILFLILMFIPSLPIPTGGFTQFILLPTVWIVAFEMMFGRRTLWLPKFITKIKLGESMLEKGLPFMIKRIKWLEKFSRPRLARYINKSILRSITGFIIFLFALASFIAPPFTGLDTLPSMGAVIIALSLMLEDMGLYLIGLAVGMFGIGILVASAGIVTNFIQNYF